VYSDLSGDKVLTQASSRELGKYGLSVGLKNYAAAYCTGLLVARRLLTKLGMADIYRGNEEITGDVVSCRMNRKKYFVSELDDDKRPFKAILDVGIKPTTTGARLFGALKGATDGGLNVPHSNKRFPGFDKDAGRFDSEVHRDHIFGDHVACYMREMQEEDEDKYNSHFSQYIKAGLGPDDLEGLYESVHQKIREDPVFQSRDPPFKCEDTTSFKHPPKLTLEQRKERIQTRIAEIQAQQEEKTGGDY